MRNRPLGAQARSAGGLEARWLSHAMSTDRLAKAMTAPLPPHPDLGLLASLVGDWEGGGHGVVGDRRFTYAERVRFWHSGKPFVGYEQRTWAQDDGRPLHSESGYWRAAGGAVEVILAHAIGHAEVETGRWDDRRLHLVATGLIRSAAAKPVTGLERDYELDGDTLRYELRMATLADQTPWVHLQAELRRL